MGGGLFDNIIPIMGCTSPLTPQFYFYDFNLIFGKFLLYTLFQHNLSEERLKTTCISMPRTRLNLLYFIHIIKTMKSSKNEKGLQNVVGILQSLKKTWFYKYHILMHIYGI